MYVLAPDGLIVYACPAQSEPLLTETTGKLFTVNVIGVLRILIHELEA